LVAVLDQLVRKMATLKEVGTIQAIILMTVRAGLMQPLVGDPY